MIIVLFVLTCTIWYFSSSGEIKINDKIKGNDNVVVNEAHRELSFLHIEHMENLGNKLDNLEDSMTKHTVIKYGLMIILFIIVGSYVGQRC